MAYGFDDTPNGYILITFKRFLRNGICAEFLIKEELLTLERNTAFPMERNCTGSQYICLAVSDWNEKLDDGTKGGLGEGKSHDKQNLLTSPRYETACARTESNKNISDFPNGVQFVKLKMNTLDKIWDLQILCQTSVRLKCVDHVI